MAVPSPTTSALLPQVLNENLFQSLSGALKDAHEHVALFRNIDGGNIGRVPRSPKYLSQWTTEKVKAESVNGLLKANVEGAIFEDYKVALTLNNGQKAGDVTFFCDIKLGRWCMEHDHHAVASGRLAGENNTGKETRIKNCSALLTSAFFVVISVRNRLIVMS
ncbi:apoptosis-inducing factor 1, mitochondrial-like isoform X2 [Daphnia pulex]|uniref:apoptosis-inducing factor 1, mitochondrial-like n=1 Tax=Daphnia pulex TaxID=6669 RepID=UPI001EDD634F|nr:apoptosis-inducing factor 1, mitochondrial-like [Daphnia pulex]XP_046443027.1 apoptosis-inducing factor 1, mitochondrial-like isoform X2 [Daphnia pulex]